MELIIEDKAIKWFEEEVGRAEGAGIRFKAMIYGSSPVHESFALQIEPSEPRSTLVEFTSENGLLFFVEKDDEWFFREHDLVVSFNDELNEPKYIYRKDGVDLN
ncbi:Fe-S cluster assembly protein HesB [Aerococcaceae bacterium DSM 111021]|nr:Fe-S cluster assembly protein HesB [Aerococcaceae bacterium DSM 111021]